MRSREFPKLVPILAFVIVASTIEGAPSPGDRLAHLDDPSPFRVDGNSARLTTPMWFGEAGVEAAVIIAIDDMRETERYRLFLEPIEKRLREIEGRSPLSIFTNRIDPADPQIARWFEEGVRLDVHTRTHPCPLLREDLSAAEREVFLCLDNLAEAAGRRAELHPAAFRMPCCDSINSASPRFFSEVLPRKSPNGRFLEADSSVLLFLDETYQPYAPFPNFAATIEGYPYPYVVGKLIWEFPIVAPSDWQAQRRYRPMGSEVIADWKRALDLIVRAQGLFTLCFHPHGWVRNDQLVELIDHAARSHGRKVRFLNFHDALERMERNLLGGTRLRAPDGEDQGVRLLDLDGDGFLDVVIGNDERRETRRWDRAASAWKVSPLPFRLVGREGSGAARDRGVRFGVLRGRAASALVLNEEEKGLYHWDGEGWKERPIVGLSIGGRDLLTARGGLDRGVRLRDLDGDGLSDLIVSNPEENGAFRWDPGTERFVPLPFALPSRGAIADEKGRDGGLRFIDLDRDGRTDVILSNDEEYYVYLFENLERGWSRRVLRGPAGGVGALPRLVSGGRDQGGWLKDGVLYVANEGTSRLADIVEMRRFDKMLENRSTPPLSPEEERATFRLPEGFRIELVAAEPLVEDPIAIDFGLDGRVWVCEMGSYPLGQGKDSGGRIRLLRDRDGDGRADESVIFADGFSFPSGVLAHGKGVLVPCAPAIYYLEDTDGDERADIRRVVFEGFGEGNQQHRVNGLHFAIDNWIHGANGDSGGEIAIPGQPERPAVSIRGRDFRISLDLADFEAESGRTQYGLALDDFGERFGASNSRHVLHAVLSDRALGRNPHVAPPDAVRDIPDGENEHGPMARIFPISRELLSLNAIHVPGHFSSACGIAVYRGETFPEEYRGSSFVCEPVANLVHRDRLERRGAAFVAHRAEAQSEFLASSDNWFRPVYCSNGPDGALYVVDMYRWVIEHPEYIPEEIRQILDFTAGRDLGRIWRVVHDSAGGKPPAPLGRDLGREDPARLVELLDHPGGWIRDGAQRLLVEKKHRAAVPPLRRLLATSRRPATRVQALWTLEGLGTLSDEEILGALADPQPEVRTQALRLAAPRLAGSSPLERRAIELAGDGELRVRLEAAIALGETQSPGAAAPLLSILERDLEDPWTRAVVLSSALPHAGRFLAGLLAKPIETGGPRGRALLSALRGLVATVAGKGDPAEIEEILAGAREAEAVRRWHFAVLAALDDAGRSPARPAAIDGERTVRARARATALDPALPLEEREEAVRALGDGAIADPPLADRLLSAGEPSELALAALAVIARRAALRPDLAPEALAAVLRAWGGAGPVLRGEILEFLLAREEGRLAILAALEKETILPREIDAPSRSRLAKLLDPAARERAARLLPLTGSLERGKIVAAYRDALASQKGQAERGREVFQKICAPCHRLDGLGSAVGPDLGEARSKGDTYLVESILDPGQMVPPRFVVYLVETKSGSTASGIIASESPAAVTLARANGQTETILRRDLRKLTATGQSLMPEEIEKQIPVADMSDLLAFLRDAPRPIGAASEAEIAEARRLAAGLNGLREVVSAVESVPQASHLGRASLSLVRQLDGKGFLAWRTEPVPADLPRDGRHTFHFPAATGYRSQPQGKFTLFLGERPLLDFDVAHESARWTSGDGAVELSYRVLAFDGEDSTGEMTLSLPASFLERGAPALLRVSGSGSGSRRWFGILQPR